MPGMTYDQVMNLWVRAGGSPQSAALAAAVADASSGLNSDASFTSPGSGIKMIGLWGVPQTLGTQASTDPLTNARAAVALSNNGTDFSQWCSAWSDNACGQNGGTLWGEGSNALAALAQRGGDVNYVNGVASVTALPTGVPTGQAQSDTTSSDSASSTASGSATSGNTTSSKTLIILLLISAAAVALWVIMKRGKTTGQAANPPPTEG